MPNKILEYRKIIELVDENAKILDLGCGDGSLMFELKTKRNARVQGIERDEKLIYVCVEKDLTVFHSSIENAITAYPGNCFDYVILYNTFQQIESIDTIIKECFRIGKHAIVSFPNFAYISARKDLLFGKSPVTKNLPYQWYDSPNLRFLSIKDFENFCCKNNYKILNSFFFREKKEIAFFPNLLAQTATFVISK
ncbi:MAG: methionine biosynthesis protein MetW [Elusimicrobiota bacterium]|nr:methionine biosynthesis protein MetW [Elusimicrobiota bacterium]